MTLPDHLALTIPSYRECELPGCHGAHYARGRCNPHYQQSKYWDDPEGARARRRARYARQKAQREAA